MTKFIDEVHPRCTHVTELLFSRRIIQSKEECEQCVMSLVCERGEREQGRVTHHP